MRALPRQCLVLGCPNQAVGTSRCRAHTRGWPGQSYGSAWPKIRARVLAEEPRCRLGLVGCTAYSTEVDHITSKASGGTDDRYNLRGVCASCHRRKTHADSELGKKRKRR